MRVNVLTLLGSADHYADVFTVLDDRIALFEIGQRHLVTDRNIVLCGDIGGCVVLGNDTQHASACFKVFDNDNADIVIWTVNEKLRNFGQVLSPKAEFCCEDFSGNDLDRSLI